MCTCIFRWNPQVKEGNNIKKLTFKIKHFLHNKQECTFKKVAFYTQLYNIQNWYTGVLTSHQTEGVQYNYF